MQATWAMPVTFRWPWAAKYWWWGELHQWRHRQHQQHQNSWGMHLQSIRPQTCCYHTQAYRWHKWSPGILPEPPNAVNEANYAAEPPSDMFSYTRMTPDSCQLFINMFFHLYVFSSIHGWSLTSPTVHEWPDKALMQDAGMEENQSVHAKATEEQNPGRTGTGMHPKTKGPWTRRWCPLINISHHDDQPTSSSRGSWIHIAPNVGSSGWVHHDYKLINNKIYGPNMTCMTNQPTSGSRGSWIRYCPKCQIKSIMTINWQTTYPSPSQL